MKRGRDTMAYLTLIPEESFESGTTPAVIKLKKGSIILGRGSPTIPVDVMLSIKAHDGKEIISRSHAEIFCGVDGSYIIHDLGSTNGVFVNGCKIDKHTLCEGDVVQFGGVAKMPVGKTIKQCAEHARYKFSFLQGISSSNKLPGPSEKRLKTRGSNSDGVSSHATASENGVYEIDGEAANVAAATAVIQQRYESLCNDYAKAQCEIERLKTDVSSAQRRGAEVFVAARSNGGGGCKSSPPPKRGVTSESPVACMIDYSALQDMVRCSICQLTLLDAVVCRCSHGFCRTCIETHLRTKGKFCPVCSGDGRRDATTERRGPYCRHTGQWRFYFRSENLDSIVYLLHQASSAEDATAFSKREKEHFRVLKAYGIDPMHSSSSDTEDDNASQKANSTSKASCRKSASHRSTATPSVCEYCGEEGHHHGQCPHDDAVTLSRGYAAVLSRGGVRAAKTRFGNYDEYRNEDDDGSSETFMK